MRSAADSPWRLPARHPRTPGSISNRPFYEGINLGTLTLTNSTVSGNSTNSFNGGGIYSHVDKTLTLNNTTITNNYANTVGGGVIYRGPFIVQNTIIAGNTAVVTGSDCYEFPGISNSPEVFSSGYNLIGDGTACDFSPTATGDQVGTELSPVDPVLGPLQDNGGPTFTHALLPGSPAINSGNPSGCADSSGNLLGTDQRGVGRPQDLICDIGAFEVTSTVVNSLADPGVGVCDSTECTLREAIAIAGGVNGITFNVFGTIFLTGGKLVINDDLTIMGPGGAAKITVDGGNASQVFNITNGTVVISNVTIANGFSTSGGGIGIEDPAALTLINSTVRDNTANGIGGGIFNLDSFVERPVSRNYPYQAAWVQATHHPRREPS